MLGYTQSSWDNTDEQQPASSEKYWAELSDNERAAAVVLGYNEDSWDNGGRHDQPDSYYKYWSELTSCGEDTSITQQGLPFAISPRLHSPHFPSPL